MDDLGKIRFEKEKEILKRNALEQSKVGFVNGQSLENILNNIEEYAVRGIVANANSDVYQAQLVNNETLTVEQALNGNHMFANLPEDIQDSLCKYLSSGRKTAQNIEEAIRQAYFSCYDIPTKYIIPTKEQLNAAKARCERSYENRFEDRAEYINAYYDYQIIELMYKGCNPLHDHRTIQQIEQNRLETMEKFNITTGRSR